MLLLLIFFSATLTACTPKGEEQTPSPVPQEEVIDPVDYAGSVNLDMNDTSTLKSEVEVHLYIDGDTVHFKIRDSFFEEGIVKARFLAVNTPESTGKIEAYGKKASNFTKEKLMNAKSIVIESDNNTWNADSTGGRYLLWIWYQTEENGPYRNLNIELLQEGLSIASNSGQNRYGETCLAALNQAKKMKLNCHSKEKDPDFYYGEAQELTLKELRNNIETYDNTKVAFEAVIFYNTGDTLHVMSYSEEDNIYYGMQVYYGATANGTLLEMFAVGNKLRIVGTVTNFQGTYQVSGLSYNIMNNNDPANTQLISTGNPVEYPLVSAEKFTTGKIEVSNNETTETKDFAALAVNTAIAMNNLQVTRIYTTSSGASTGAMTITCDVNGVTVTIRTEVLRDASGNLITASKYNGKNISVQGMIEMYDGKYQIKVFAAEYITIND